MSLNYAVVDTCCRLSNPIRRDGFLMGILRRKYVLMDRHSQVMWGRAPNNRVVHLKMLRRNYLIRERYEGNSVVMAMSQNSE